MNIQIIILPRQQHTIMSEYEKTVETMKKGGKERNFKKYFCKIKKLERIFFKLFKFEIFFLII